VIRAIVAAKLTREKAQIARDVRPVEVIYEDDKTDIAAAQDATRKLIERDRVLAVIGPITSRNLDAIAPMAAESKDAAAARHFASVAITNALPFRDKSTRRANHRKTCPSLRAKIFRLTCRANQ
jgi:Periplasmic binding protein